MNNEKGVVIVLVCLGGLGLPMMYARRGVLWYMKCGRYIGLWFDFAGEKRLSEYLLVITFIGTTDALL